MDKSQTQNTPAKAKPLVMVVHERRHGADLNGVGVIGRILEQTVVRVKELPRHQKEKLSRRAAVVQSEHDTEHTDGL